MFFRGDITKHSRPQPSDLCGTDSRSDMVVSGSNIRYQRAERVERGVMAFFNLTFHVLFNFMHRNVSGAFNKCLNIFIPGTEHQLSHGIEFGKLRFIVCVVDRTRTKSVT